MRIINPVPIKGPYKVSVTVTTGDGEKQFDTEMAKAVNMEDVISYYAAKAAKRTFRSICWDLVTRTHPELQHTEKEFHLIWRATLCGNAVSIHTAEEIAAMQVKAGKPGSRRWHFNNVRHQLRYAWDGVKMAMYELWRAIRG